MTTELLSFKAIITDFLFQDGPTTRQDNELIEFIEFSKSIGFIRDRSKLVYNLSTDETSPFFGIQYGEYDFLTEEAFFVLNGEKLPVAETDSKMSFLLADKVAILTERYKTLSDSTRALIETGEQTETEN